METKLTRIAEMAKADPKPRFTSIGYFIEARALMESHREMKPEKATGVDGVTKETYEANLEANVENLVKRLRSKRADKKAPPRLFTSLKSTFRVIPPIQ